MNHFKKKGLEKLVIHTCDGDDDLTEEQLKQAFCLDDEPVNQLNRENEHEDKL